MQAISGMRWIRTLAALAAVAAGAFVQFPAAAAGPTFFRHSCPQTLVTSATLRCGTVVVFENRNSPGSRAIGLNVIVISAPKRPAAKDAIFGISGGPGQPSADQTGLGFATMTGDAASTRDIVLVDQRGTGDSHPLQCDLFPGTDITRFFGSDWPVQVLSQCAQRLSAIADLTQYNTDNSADDLDDVRAALGYDQIDLVGVSYGTTVALDYMRRHAQHVRTAVLDGPVATDSKGPLPYARAAQNSIDGLFADCSADAGCHAAIPDPRGDLAAALSTLSRGAVHANATDPATKVKFPVQIDAETWVSTVRYGLYDANSSVQLLRLIHAAAHGDFDPSADMTVAIRTTLATNIFWGMAMSLGCPEEVNTIDPSEIGGATRGSFFGDYRVRAQIAACAVWPHATVDPAFFHPVRSNAPALLLTGGVDPATPADQVARIQRYLPHAVNVLFPKSADAGETTCGARLVAAFISAGSSAGLETSCAAATKRPPFTF
ncbi:MAG TPA: alpha/beta fold hydrolase [Candidatus Eremiobacteraceae bacterium]|nr:alpha/beta fold hydrolase [Candidatus Eremiobacteraceae bacterium]